MSLELLNAAGRVLLLSGASGGIGRKISELYIAAGGKVAALDLTPPAETAELFPIACDATDEAALNQAVADAIGRFGRIDALVHAAGIVGKGALADMALEDWRRVMDANLTSAFLIARAAYPHLRKAKGAAVFLGSTNGRNGGSHLSGAAYASAKAAIANLTRYLAKEWAPDVRVNVVAPGPVRTPMLDRLPQAELDALKSLMLTGDLIEAEDVAASIAFLLSEHARSITGACLNLSGGMVLD